MKLTRRQLAGAIAGAATTAAQTQPPQAAAEDEEMRAARERLKTAATALAQRQIPMATEPAFQFKA